MGQKINFEDQMMGPPNDTSYFQQFKTSVSIKSISLDYADLEGTSDIKYGNYKTLH